MENTEKINLVADPNQRIECQIKYYQEHKGLLHQIYGPPRMDNLIENNNLLGKETQKVICEADKTQLPRLTIKMICQTCKKLSSEGLWPILASRRLSEGKLNLSCCCLVIDRLNRLRKNLGGPRISNTQVYEAMKDVLKCPVKVVESGWDLFPPCNQ